MLGLLLIGQQNTPVKGAWKANQADDEPNKKLEMYYMIDNTGVLIISFTKKSIKMERLGYAPSLQYVLQESILLHGLLDELQQLATDDSIEQENRLVAFTDDDAIDAARSQLPARAV